MNSLEIKIVIGVVFLALIFGWHFWEVKSAYTKGFSAAVDKQSNLVVEQLGRNTKSLMERAERIRVLESENEKLKELDASIPVRVVRLRLNQVSSSPVPSGDSGTSQAPAGTGTLPQDWGPDIGGRLKALWLEADEILARCRATPGC